jgi:hypothetical protein
LNCFGPAPGKSAAWSGNPEDERVSRSKTEPSWVNRFQFAAALKFFGCR